MNLFAIVFNKLCQSNFELSELQLNGFSTVIIFHIRHCVVINFVNGLSLISPAPAYLWNFDLIPNLLLMLNVSYSNWHVIEKFNFHQPSLLSMVIDIEKYPGKLNSTQAHFELLITCSHPSAYEIAGLLPIKAETDFWDFQSTHNHISDSVFVDLET